MLKLRWLDSLPLLKAALPPESHLRMEQVFEYATDVDIDAPEFKLTDWDAYLAENHEMFAPLQYVDESGQVFRVQDLTVLFSGNHIQQTLHLRTLLGEPAGIVILEGDKEDGETTEET